MIVTIIAFVIVFGVLVFVHEFGHFYAAKKSGILVREFSIGMGPKLFAYHKNGTTYTWRLLPLGGYVRMAGLEDDEESLKKGSPVTLLLDKQDQVTKINTSQKKMLKGGLPLIVTDWDLQKKMWIEGYENGDESQVKRFNVKRDAMITEEDGTEIQVAPLDVQYQSVSVPKRIVTNFAGPFNNFILAIIAFGLVAMLQGGVQIPTNSNVIGTVQKDSVAAKAGLKAGDQIVAIDGHQVSNWQDLVSDLGNRGGKKTTLKVKQAKQTKEIQLTPKTVKQNGQKTGQIGITEKIKTDHSIGAILAFGFTQTWNIIMLVFSAIGHMITHGFSLNDLGGPVAMYSMTAQAAHHGAITVINLMGLLSVNLGIMNLLPIPALDGGKILLNIIEGIRKKPMDPNKEVVITMIGFAFLMILMVLVTWNDIRRYFF
ncbi:RIP metalloprotease RseP [Ligilactobacillus aviarius]|uniref:Zinc metalloprotease n=1 Tax=Ligilactobacillus aviarius TaxID=1606 RepID=A0A179C6A2_9LACO|nr:RIP metalloprotease RseP [Ligilactobacillus aviarius]OAP97433.1 metalloprotease RseP [Ligilactobacillus aviarius]OAQ00896.1 metalloprotease RseP [Ligilactobacillus aviarius]OAQ01161.1 metalloprotease RseP [Ligilactobacillus aviarius]OAQ06085.1 metalloprotease RseP [Ligilactobacillus aviarius]OAQ08696.1 metalloprotease RseP [Ligilactobacillus aviarius]